MTVLRVVNDIEVGERLRPLGQGLVGDWTELAASAPTQHPLSSSIRLEVFHTNIKLSKAVFNSVNS